MLRSKSLRGLRILYTFSVTAFGLGLLIVHNLVPANPIQVTNPFVNLKSNLALLLNKCYNLLKGVFIALQSVIG